MTDVLLDLLIIIAKIVIVLGVNFTILLVLGIGERRISAYMQDRIGPNRVGPKGLFQTVADGVKFMFKEDIIPYHVDKVIYLLAPLMVLGPALMAFAVIPFGESFSALGRQIHLQIADLNVGLLYIFAIVSLSVYGIILGGWSSNSKYPLMGGIRSAAQVISYELSMGLAIIGVLMISGTFRLNEIVTQQNQLLFGILPNWNIFLQPVGFIIFLIAVFAETNRLPFDLPEAEPELVAGYHTEYSSMKFLVFYLGEYVAMVTASALISTLYLGGWDFPYVDESTLGWWGVVLSVVALAAKMGFFLFLFIWVRWTLPRFRFDQLMRLGWKVLLPIALANVVLTAIIISFLQ
ncbi:MAG: NADH-quinone oxidoreductase subunit NuoH [bacterium]